MKKTKILFRKMEIQKELLKIQNKEIGLIKDLKEKRKSCNHEITISTCDEDTPTEIFCVLTRTRTYCFLCDEYLSPRKYYPDDLAKKVEKSININLHEYPKIRKLWGMKNYTECLIEIYKEVCHEYENLSEYEIGRIMKSRIEAIEAFI